ncbi:MAG: citrate (Si)-synthase [Anaerolineaceae bacterium]|nr:citrate (Si)-synthase [Anaerolineaceae bacterium]
MDTLSTSLEINHTHSNLEAKIASQIPAWRERVQHIVKHYGTTPIGQITVAQMYGGMRGVHALITEISHVDPFKGIRIRGYTISEILSKLPKHNGNQFPLAGGLYYLLMASEFPSLDDALAVEHMWKQRQEVPGYVFDLLRILPDDTHPMTLFSQAILSMQRESVAARAYHDGISKADYWKPILEDSLNLTAKLPTIAATIYNMKYRGGVPAVSDPGLDWSANFAHMIGMGGNPEYQELTRLFMLLHSDQENGNASAHTSHLVSSTLSDVYYSCSAGMNALAGPLHGLANQECLRWLLKLQERYGGLPTHAQLEEFAWETLNAGKVIPGYGHGVLRCTDPRFIAQFDFAEQYMPDDPIFQLVRRVYEVMPKVLGQTGKVKNPYPNVDAISGTLQYHYGVRHPEFYTVLFGMSRQLGLTTHAVWARALGQPIERPKSLTTDILEEMLLPNDVLPASNHFFE